MQADVGLVLFIGVGLDRMPSLTAGRAGIERALS